MSRVHHHDYQNSGTMHYKRASMYTITSPDQIEPCRNFVTNPLYGLDIDQENHRYHTLESVVCGTKSEQSEHIYETLTKVRTRQHRIRIRDYILLCCGVFSAITSLILLMMAVLGMVPSSGVRIENFSPLDMLMVTLGPVLTDMISAVINIGLAYTRHINSRHLLWSSLTGFINTLVTAMFLSRVIREMRPSWRGNQVSIFDVGMAVVLTISIITALASLVKYILVYKRKNKHNRKLSPTLSQLLRCDIMFPCF